MSAKTGTNQPKIFPGRKNRAKLFASQNGGKMERQIQWHFFLLFFAETTNKKSEITPSDPSSSSWSSSSTSCWLETLCHAAISLASVSASVAVCQVPKAEVTQEVDGRWGGGRKGEEPNW